jgi:predicted ArsR family transcriptional regulator
MPGAEETSSRVAVPTGVLGLTGVPATEPGGNGRSPGLPIREMAPIDADGDGVVDSEGHGHAPSSPLRREILATLRQNGPSSPDRLAAFLGASRTGVLQQLRALEEVGLVTRQTVRHGVGRPRHLYDVTPDAQGLFPANYGALAAGLLAAISAVGGDDLVEEVFRARRQQIALRVRTQLEERCAPDASLADRVRELAVLQDGQGYLCRASVEEDGTILLREHNCAIYHVAMGHPAACGAELELFRDVLGVDVVRESHIASGDRACVYRVVDAAEA